MTSIYRSHLAWSNQKESKILAQKAARLALEDSSCTFSPSLSASSSHPLASMSPSERIAKTSQNHVIRQERARRRERMRNGEDGKGYYGPREGEGGGRRNGGNGGNRGNRGKAKSAGKRRNNSAMIVDANSMNDGLGYSDIEGHRVIHNTLPIPQGGGGGK